MKLKELASKLGLKLRGEGEIEILAPVPIEAAVPCTIIFSAGAKYAAALRITTAAAAIVPADLIAEAKCATLESPNPVFDFSRVLGLFFPPYRPPAGIHPTAIVAPGAVAGDDVSVGAYCVIGSSVTIGDDFTCHSHVSIREGVTIGNRVTLLNGAVIGADGFGFVENNSDLIKVPQVGSVVIEDDVEIGANTTVDRATMGATIIHRGVKLDNLIQIGHNCEIGDYSRFAAQSGLAGSVTVGQWCQFGGQSGCADHVKVGDRARAIAQAGVHNDLDDDALVGGAPAIDMRVFRRMVAVEPRLPEMLRRIRALEQHLGIGRDRG